MNIFFIITSLTTWTPNIPDTKGYDTYKTAPFHPSIHNFGNTGIFGRLHANSAGIATRCIDRFAYKGRNMRREVAQGIRQIKYSNTSVIDVGCGVGILTKELYKSGFEDVTGLDTSLEMLNTARKLSRYSPISYRCMNGVDFEKDVDLAIISMVMHEMPTTAHIAMTQNLLKCTEKRKGEVWIIDIDPVYQPSNTMLSGEPFALNYLQSVDNTLNEIAHTLEKKIETFSIIPNHVRGWVISHES
tara:strand:- start:467 stop:1198 length:732 start_codon:yes stop_codon:yes gene_type:complete